MDLKPFNRPFPPDIERIIMEMAADASKHTAVQLTLVAKRAQIWCVTLQPRL